MNNIFGGSREQIKNTFTPTFTGLQDNPQKALVAVNESFTTIGTVMTEGNVLPDHANFALQKLYEAKLAVETAIARGWAGGKSQ